MYAFEFHSAGSVAEVVSALKADEEAKPLAGGMTLLPTMKLRLANPTQLVSLDGVGEMHGITRDGDAIVVGAMTRHAEVARDAQVNSAIPALAHLASHIGDPQVRNRGTIGGSIANNDPAADYPAGLVGLGATVH
ncbi:MAG: FAD binding domain-containing protein, partial [Pseudomonadota bacterium]